MCRIAGIFKPSFSKEQLQHQLIKMCDAQAHGGPDGYGYWFSKRSSISLGHRRLSLLDLSIAGHQPMIYKHLVISFNGEIYNFRELKLELQHIGHQFKSDSDTEVILHAYEEWGCACFSKLNGMFALAIYDELKNSLILARDVAGIKPLYYHQKGADLIFASEVKAFHQSGKIFEDEASWKIYFLSFGFIPEPYTTLKDVFSLKPGHFLKYAIDEQKIETECFDEFHFSSEIATFETAKTFIGNTLSQSVKRHLISDAPIGVFLSGGIDSSIISILAAQNSSKKIQTLSVSFEEGAYDESVYQNIVQQQIQSEHTHYQVTKRDYLDAIPVLKNAFDQPSNDAINSWFICKCAKQNGLKAVLSGLGGDELFGGYPSFSRMGTMKSLQHLPLRIFKIADHLSDDRLKKLAFLSKGRTYADYLFLRGFYTPHSISKLIDATEEEVHQALNSLVYQSPRNQTHPLNYASWLEQNIYMRSQLLKDTDYMSMQHGVEVRVPFLDKEFLKLAHQIDPKIKFNSKIPKHLLIQSFAKELPRAVYQRKKMGFTFPFQEWNKSHPELPLLISHSNKEVAKLSRQFMNDKLHWSRCFALLQILDFLPQKDALFLTLKTFSHTGGIEKVNRILMKAGTDLQSEQLIRFYAKSLHDDQPNEKYITSRRFQGFEGHLIPFIYQSVKKGMACDIVMFSHINLALVGLLIKFLHPKTKLLLQAHGIEVWDELSYLKKLFLKKADLVLAVSEYTQNTVINQHGVQTEQCIVFHNSLDPFFNVAPLPKLVDQLKKKYSILPGEKVLVTLTRLVTTEKYKGYDKVIEAMAQLNQGNPVYKYLLMGKYDVKEFKRIQQLIKTLHQEKQVILCGFVDDVEISSYFNLADVFVMPSQKEGFGIVFIEAMACGLPVIAGNKDGSVDALKQGEFGTLIDPNSISELKDALIHFNQHTYSTKPELLKKEITQAFGYEKYKSTLKTLLLE